MLNSFVSCCKFCACKCACTVVVRSPRGGGGGGPSLGDRPPGGWWGTVFPGVGNDKGGGVTSERTLPTFLFHGPIKLFSVTSALPSCLLTPSLTFCGRVWCLWFPARSVCVCVCVCVSSSECLFFCFRPKDVQGCSAAPEEFAPTAFLVLFLGFAVPNARARACVYRAT